ncbi:MAG: LamG-like jellyroll fold domain-containing protein, partial [Alphaproteobacteria bacterium]
LECGPRDDVVDWANQLLERHADRLAIVVTHAYLFRDNTRYDHTSGKSQRASPHGWGNDGEELWQKLVRRHRNTMMVLSGHVSTGGLGYLASEADYGNTVHQLMVDYEKMRGGGMAYLRLLEFLPDGKTVQVRTYSPALKTARKSPLEEFRFTLKFADRDTPKPQNAESHLPLKPPRHRYSFDGRGGAGAKIIDSIGGAHGVLRGETGRSRLNGTGQLVLGGNDVRDGYAELPARMLSKLKAVSVEVWFAPMADRYNWNSVWRFGDGGGDFLWYTLRALTVHRAEIAVAGDNQDIQRKGVPAAPGKPLHVVVTYDPEGADGKPLLRCYRDGALVGSLVTSKRLVDVTDTQNRLGPVTGIYDELRIYDYALDPAAVRRSYAAGSAPAGPPRNSKEERQP